MKFFCQQPATRGGKVSGGPVLVIKLGALGDFIQALGPMKAIRTRHRNQDITLLTTAPFVSMAEATGLFDRVQVDLRPGRFEPAGWWRLRKFLRNGSFSQVYDLQTSNRSSWYFRLFFPGPVPQWSGIAKGCSHFHSNPDRNNMHTLDRQRDQLKVAGIAQVPPADLGWANADLAGMDLPDRFALLVPGGAPHRPAKRWPVDRFRVIAEEMTARDIVPVVIGSHSEAGLAADILVNCPGGIDLTGQTDLLQLATLVGRASGAVGNDTGPMHLIAVSGCPCLVLFSGESDPDLCAPRGKNVAILQAPQLTDLPTGRVAAVVNDLIARSV